MTPEKQRIKIAEACGWEVIEYTLCNVKPDKNGDPEIEPIAPLPDYLNDLNAMQDAERHFVGDASKAMAYAMHLLRACGLSIASEYDELNVDYCWHACHATAAQRAEAFLKTLNLWEE